ncbi:hypothetical protein KCTC52924_00853 [Arenibacter antarcticus]|uniref:DUF3748 domain-containing protein n=1 Tax=Arenibacter antarcticus TaxID=2040469 RepID=A0ABW5VA70_9FLAO|nr:DUF3748 domain-containing protein [Arenibacter sp. H213]
MNSNSTYIDLENLQEVQLTNNPAGHFLNQRQAFSPHDKFLVFDNRNDDSKIGENAYIQLVDVDSKVITTIYELQNQTVVGPGSGAVSFHPFKNEVLFIHGLMNASKEHPYGITRRFAMQVDMDNSNTADPLEARDVKAPFTKGALRGGTHAYSYSSDGQFVSFTYNDEILENESNNNPNVSDLRTVGALLLGEKLTITGEKNKENFDGNSFAILLAEVKANPQFGSDEISKAYEECWVGDSGYVKTNGGNQKRALAFLGDVVSESGQKVTEVFIADIPEDISNLKNSVNTGSKTTLPSIPTGVKQRRLTFTTENKHPGVSGPRQWLRSSPDGSSLYFYQTDNNEIVQLYSVSPNGGKIKAITNNNFSPDTSFALSADGKYLAYGSQEALYVTAVENGETTLVLPASVNKGTHLSNINWSNSGYTIAYNRKVDYNGETFYQIFTLNLTKTLNQ